MKEATNQKKSTKKEVKKETTKSTKRDVKKPVKEEATTSTKKVKPKKVVSKDNTIKTKKATGSSVKPTDKNSTTKVEKPHIKEELKKEEAIIKPNNDVVSNKDSFIKRLKLNYKPIIIVAAIILVIILIFTLTKNSDNKSYNLSEISEAYADSSLKINLPKNWMISEDGEFYEVVNDKLSPRGAFAGAISNKEDFDAMMDAYSQYYDLEYIEVNGIQIAKIQEEYESQLFTYYLSFNEETSIANQIIFINVEDAVQLEILNNIK